MSVHLAGINHLSPSGASVLVDCERKFWWTYTHDMGRDERSEPLALGSGMATALEFDNIDRGVAEYRAKRPLLDGWTDPDEWERTGEIGAAIVQEAYAGYLRTFPGESSVKREQTYLCSLDPDVTDRVLQVRVDGLVPGITLIEDKLRGASSMRAEAIENEVRQGRQITAEIYGHWRTHDEILPVNLRCVKKPDPRKLKGKDTGEAIDVVVQHFMDGAAFHEFTCTRTRDQLLDFETEFIALAARGEELMYHEVPVGARNTDACHKYGRVCPALSHCQGMLTTQTLIETLHPPENVPGLTPSDAPVKIPVTR